MQKEQLKKEQQRYSNLLRMHKYNYCQHQLYQNLQNTIKLLKEILQLSKTKQGRQKLYDIESWLIDFYLIEPIHIRWQRYGYWEVDNLILKILGSLAKDQIFLKSLLRNKSRLIDLNIRVRSSVNFTKLITQAIKQINQRQKQQKQKAPKNIYKTSFSNKQQFWEQIQKHGDFYNFPRSLLYLQEYKDYVNMLMGGIKSGLKNQIIRVFPKDCFGCLIFTMVVTGYQTNQANIAIDFLKQYTDNWTTQAFYNSVLERIKNFYRYYGRNANLSDRSQLVCLRLHQDKSYAKLEYYLYEYFDLLNRALSDKKLHTIPKIHSSQQLIQQLRKLKDIDGKKKNRQDIQNNIKRKFNSQKYMMKPYLTKSFLSQSGEQFRANTQNLLSYLTMKQYGSQISEVILTYRFSQQVSKYKLERVCSLSDYQFFMIKLKSGNILGGYSQNRCSKPKQFNIFNYGNKKCYNFGILESYGRIRKIEEKELQYEWVDRRFIEQQQNYQIKKQIQIKEDQNKYQADLNQKYNHLIFECSNSSFYFTISTDKQKPMIKEFWENMSKESQHNDENKLIIKFQNLQIYKVKINKSEKLQQVSIGQYFYEPQVKNI